MSRKKKKQEKVEYNSLEERKKALEQVMREVNKKNETESLMYASKLQAKNSIPWGIPEIDKLTGGIRKGLFQTIWGDEGCSKSSATYKVTAQAQKEQQIVVLIDLEHKFSPDWASKMGVNLDELVLMQDIDNAEQAMETVRTLARNKVADLIIIDSIHGLMPKGEKYKKSGAEKEMDKETIALLARTMSKFFKMVSNDIAKNNVAVLFVGQARVGGIGTFYVRDVLSGGRAISFWSAMILRFRKGQSADAPKVRIKEGDKTKETRIGFNLVVKLEKTQVVGTMRENSETSLPFYYETGFDAPKEIKNGKQEKED